MFIPALYEKAQAHGWLVCKPSARPNSAVCVRKSICDRCMSGLMNGVRVCVCDELTRLQLIASYN